MNSTEILAFIFPWLWFVIALGGILYVLSSTISAYWTNRKNFLDMNLKHEIALKEKEWELKIIWENMITEKLVSTDQDERQKEVKELKEKVDKLYKKQDEIPQIDLNRIAMLHLLLSEKKIENISAETLDDEIEKAKKTYNMITKFLK